MPPNKETAVRTEEIGNKTFGFQVQEYRGKMYLVGREMYDDGSGLTFGRNGVNITIDGAYDYIRNMIITLTEFTGKTVEEIVNELGF